MAKQLQFKDMMSCLETISKKTSMIIESTTNVRKYIDTGVYILNAALSKSIFGGVADNRMTVFAGPTSVGKSYLCNNIAKKAQLAGYNIFYIDTEFAAELDEFQNYGIDVNKNFTLLRCGKVEDMKIMLTQLINYLKTQKQSGVDIGKSIIFLDSIGQLASEKEVEDALEGKSKTDMSRAKAIKQFFRIINADLGYLNIAMVCTNHTYKTMDLFPQEVMSGGEGANYSASTIVFLSKAKLKTGEEDEMDLGQSGSIITAQTRKNRLAKPKKVKFEIDFGVGTNPYKGLEMFCTVENFPVTGVAKVKKVVTKSKEKDSEGKFIETVSYEPGGTKWYVKHLDATFYEKQIFNSKVFTKDVLQALDPIIVEYFSYGSGYEEYDVVDVIDELPEFDIDSEEADSSLFD